MRSLVIRVLFLPLCLLSAPIAVAIPQASFVELRSYKKPIDVSKISVADPIWKSVSVYKQPLQRQFLVDPKPADVGVKEISVQSIYDGTAIAIRLSWQDTTKNDQPSITDFSDGASIEFPVHRDPLPEFFMGAPNRPVHLLHWRAWRSRDQAQGFQTVKSAYPNMVSEMYNFDYKVNGKGTEHTDKEKEMFTPGRAANNPLSFPHNQIIEEANAEGPGTLKSKGIENTSGEGIWENGKWSVVFCRPLHVNDANSVQFGVGEKTPIAFAVWEGSMGEVGGRKAVSAAWAEILLERVAP